LKAVVCHLRQADWMTEKGCGRLAGIAGAAGDRLKEVIGGIGLA
jgi:hypothetical protein